MYTKMFIEAHSTHTCAGAYMQEPLPSRLLILFLLSLVLIEVSLEVTPRILMRWHRYTMKLSRETVSLARRNVTFLYK
jgi:hypothetical protein